MYFSSCLEVVILCFALHNQLQSPLQQIADDIMNYPTDLVNVLDNELPISRANFRVHAKKTANKKEQQRMDGYFSLFVP